VLKNCTLQDATAVVCGALELLENQPIACDGLSLHVTISAGLVVASDQSSVAELMREADEALYASKQAGRNCVHAFANGGCELLTHDDAPREPVLCLAADAPPATSEMDLLRHALRMRMAQVDSHGKNGV
jgi:predicted signal transduction protein with EAL and GGDEF domain